MEALTSRPWGSDDEPFLWQMLYQSLHVHEGEEPFPRSVLEKPDIAHYLQNFGSRSGDDAQLCVGPAGERIAAAWCRRFTSEEPGYGYVDGDVVPL